MLRAEVGFVCAAPQCDSPYLEYHHFDPPWAGGNSHRPEGMIALCATHHGLADGGAYTREELHRWKAAKREPSVVNATIPWRREATLFRLGGGVCLGVPNILELNRARAIWLTKADDGQDLLNFDLHGADGSIAFEMRESVWTAHPAWEDIEVAPQGRTLSLRAEKLGIRLSLRFHGATQDNVIRLIGAERLENLTKLLGDTSELFANMLICEMEGQLPWPRPIKFTPTHILWGGSSMQDVAMFFGQSFLRL